jgi:hypothetical protein|tara:strand:- start:854 stop:1018 length:165 start_codon:yes stop_codon:yes gene_type:complete
VAEVAPGCLFSLLLEAPAAEVLARNRADTLILKRALLERLGLQDKDILAALGIW